ncbi:MAG: choice-of-anchor B family protein [Longimicrobiales bacterium]|nr:choice-of-anchor B family protein [Longimicrobiales bacterium]
MTSSSSPRPPIRLAGPIPFALLLTALLPGAGTAQDAFGSAVAVTGPGEVAVLKPGAVRGPAQAQLFRRVAGGWTPDGALPMLGGGFPGETLTPVVSASADGSAVLLGAGDPAGALAGHLYLRDGAGWRGAGRIPVDPGTPPPAGLPATGLDMGTLLALMGPPPRIGILDGEGRRMAVAGGALGGTRVRILTRPGTDWTAELDLEVPEEARRAGLGGALAFDGNRILAGAPGLAQGGGGLLWAQSGPDGRWTLAGRFAADSLQRDGSLGQAVALAGGEALLGAPGLDQVLRYGSDQSEGWVLLGVLEGGSRPDGRTAAYGAALAASADLLAVGAPRAREGRGEVVVYRREGEAGWTLSARLAPEDLRPGDGFGSALALGHGHLVVGAPGAWGGQGRAAVFDLDAPGSLPAWLEAGEPLERSVGEARPCAGGEAGGFACHGVDLVSFLPLSAMGAEPGGRVSDIWGWTDPETGREYVLAGRTAGLAVLDITEPGNPVFVGLLPANPSSARDIKVYRDHAFFTGDGAGDHGLLVFDLTRLRGVDPAAMPATFEPDARYDQVASAHNLIVDTESGFAYTVGTNTGGRSCGGGLHMIDIHDPLNPTFAGCFTDTEGLIWSGRTHDAQCTVYRGPDEAYRGRQICFAANETAMRIVDVTDKANPVAISAMSHPGTAYVHQGWLTEDQRYLYVNDELDEIVGTSERTRTLIWDVAELDDPILVGEHLGPDQATDHNLYIRGNRAYLANYQAGLRILDISDPEAPVEIGFFDTTPYGPNPPGFGGGAWTAFPFFDSGLVVVSSINEGIFVLKPRPILP